LKIFLQIPNKVLPIKTNEVSKIFLLLLYNSLSLQDPNQSYSNSFSPILKPPLYYSHKQTPTNLFFTPKIPFLFPTIFSLIISNLLILQYNLNCLLKFSTTSTLIFLIHNQLFLFLKKIYLLKQTELLEFFLILHYKSSFHH
jgi:hypothetical protein